MKLFARLAGAALLTIAGVQAGAAEPALFSSRSRPELEPTWAWVAGAAVVGLVVGFVFGWRMLGRHIRKKYGGLKIY